MAVKKELDTGQQGVQKNGQSANGSNLQGVSQNTNTELAKYQSGYKPSETVVRAQQNLQNVQSNKPTAFSSTFEQELDSLYDQVKNRGPFTYDINGDALYQQYAQNYKKAGQQAMKDTIGQASAMTGGYGNSYAETAGFQAYQNYMNQLNDKALDFYQLAQSRYDAEGDRLSELYGMTNDRYQTEYGQHRDAVGDYYQDYANAYNQYSDERSLDYEKFVDMWNYWQSQAAAENSDHWAQTEFDYQKGRDAVSDSQWQQQLAYQKERDAISDSQWAQEFKYQKEQDALENALASGEAYSEDLYNALLEAGKGIYENGKDPNRLTSWLESLLENGYNESLVSKLYDEIYSKDGEEENREYAEGKERKESNTESAWEKFKKTLERDYSGILE